MTEVTEARLAAAEKRIAALESVLAEHQRALQAVFGSPAMRLSKLQLGDLLVVRKITKAAPITPKGDAAESPIHPHDAAIKAGGKLAALAARDNVGAIKA